MAEGTERFEGKTPAEIWEELARFLRETLARDRWRQAHGQLRHAAEHDQAERKA